MASNMDTESGNGEAAVPDVLICEMETKEAGQDGTTATTNEMRGAVVRSIMAHVGMEGDRLAACTLDESEVRAGRECSILAWGEMDADGVRSKEHAKMVNTLLLVTREGQELAKGVGKVESAKRASTLMAAVWVCTGPPAVKVIFYAPDMEGEDGMAGWVDDQRSGVYQSAHGC